MAAGQDTILLNQEDKVLAYHLKEDRKYVFYYDDALKTSERKTLLQADVADIYYQQIHKIKNVQSLNPNLYYPFYMGLGIGLDYGGLGMKINWYPARYTGLVIGVGHNFLEPAFSIGIKGRYYRYGRIVSPYLQLLYGYLLLHFQELITTKEKVFYGMNFGGGIDLFFNRTNNIGANLGLQAYFYNQEAKKLVNRSELNLVKHP